MVTLHLRYQTGLQQGARRGKRDFMRAFVLKDVPKPLFVTDLLLSRLLHILSISLLAKVTLGTLLRRFQRAVRLQCHLASGPFDSVAKKRTEPDTDLKQVLQRHKPERNF